MSGRCKCRKRRASGAVVTFICSLLLAGADAVAEPPQPPVARLPVLTTARQAHSLTFSQAALAYPVHLRGVVTFYDPYQEGQKALFVADPTGGIFVATGLGALPPMHAGSIIDITGVTNPGGYAPIVISSRIRLLPGSAPLPQPRPGTIPHLLAGTEDGQWVALDGIVHSVDLEEEHAVLTLATSDGTLTATTDREKNADYASLVDAQIRLRGVAAPLVDAKRRMIGVRILFPGLQSVTLEKRGPANPFALPIQPLGSLLQYSLHPPGGHRIHLQGKVTLSWPGQKVCIVDASDGLCMQTSDRTALRDGQLIDVVGFPALENYRPTLSDATLRVISDSDAAAPVFISAENAFSGAQDGELVRIEGTLMGRYWAQGQLTLLLSSEKALFSAMLPAGPLQQQEGLGSAWAVGSTVAVTGVFAGKVDPRETTRQQGVSRLESFQILLRSPADVAIVHTPTWWNSRHAFIILESLALLIVGILGWVVVLRHQVRQQTSIIRNNEQRFRYLAQHDALTSVFVRTVLLERLEAEMKKAAQNETSLALFMIDVDGFKQLNDTMGHAAGDDILVALSRRIQGSVRETDTVARMGGDEFIALLPGVHGTPEAERIASQVLGAISVPFTACETDVSVSVSIGVTVYPGGGKDTTSLLHSADVALYRAKAMGRNRHQLYFDIAQVIPFESRTLA
jgi:diguanylate cyclase (GGDEF)-like protein